MEGGWQVIGQGQHRSVDTWPRKTSHKHDIKAVYIEENPTDIPPGYIRIWISCSCGFRRISAQQMTMEQFRFLQDGILPAGAVAELPSAFLNANFEGLD